MDSITHALGALTHTIAIIFWAFIAGVAAASAYISHRVTKWHFNGKLRQAEAVYAKAVEKFNAQLKTLAG